jgi:hypothetical protein
MYELLNKNFLLIIPSLFFKIISQIYPRLRLCDEKKHEEKGESLWESHRQAINRLAQ